ncbi:hypothetical protein R84981_001473 [Carnimonas sp. R-84981]|uniref:PqiC family protein n=1 Tax=Carnimonas bestiolae TaxID=3402172 RepID=UPI003EDB8EF2
MTTSLATHLLRSGAALSLLALLSGCGGGAVDMHYYNLPSANQPPLQKQTATQSRTPLSVAPITLSSYLSGSGIVYQTSPVEYSEAQLNLWADDLSEQLTSQLRDSLDQRLGYAEVLPTGADTSNAQRVAIKLSQFQGRYDGKAVIKGRYQLYDASQHTLLDKPIDVSVPLKKDGYEALVSALGDAWQQVAQQIAVTLDGHAAATQRKAAASKPILVGESQLQQPAGSERQ